MLLPNVLQRAPRVEERKARRRQPRHGIVDLPRHLGADHVKADKQRARHKQRIVVKQAVRDRRALQRRLVRRKGGRVARLVPLDRRLGRRHGPAAQPHARRKGEVVVRRREDGGDGRAGNDQRDDGAGDVDGEDAGEEEDGEGGGDGRRRRVRDALGGGGRAAKVGQQRINVLLGRHGDKRRGEEVEIKRGLSTGG